MEPLDINVATRSTKWLYVVIYTGDVETRRVTLRGPIDHIFPGTIGSRNVRKLVITRNTLECGHVLSLCRFLASNSTVKYLDLSQNRIGDVGAAYLGNLLKENNTLTELHLDCNSIGNKGAKSICDGLKYNTGLTRLHLQRNPCGTGVCELGIECLKYNVTLKQLNFSHPWSAPNFQKLDRYLNKNILMSEIGSTKYHAVSGHIVPRPQHNIKIPVDSLNLSTMKYTETRRTALLELLPEILRDSDVITSLNLSNNTLSCETYNELSIYLSSSFHLKSLILQACKISARGMNIIGESLTKNNSLTRLDLSMCFLGTGLSHLMTHLANNSSIRDLSISGCNWILGSPLANYIKNPNFSLERLNIGGNKMGDVCALSDAISTNDTLTHLNLSSGSLGPSHGSRTEDLFIHFSRYSPINKTLKRHLLINFSRCLSINETLKYLDLSNNQLEYGHAFTRFCANLQRSSMEYVNLDRIGVKDEWCIDLGECLKRNASITGVSLAYNDITDLGVKYLCHRLISNKCVSSVDLSSNPITNCGLAHMRDMLLSNKTITQLVYSNPYKGDQSTNLNLKIDEFAKIDGKITQSLLSNRKY